MKSGIYSIINIENGHRYIGSAQNVDKRISTHIRNLKNNKHHSVYLQRAWNKYGENKFIFHILELCEIKNLLSFEQIYIDRFIPEYNMAKYSSSPMKGRRHSEETVEKFKRAERIKGKDHYLYGKKLSEEHKRRMLEARKGYKHSEKTKLKMSETNKMLGRHKDLKESIERQKRKIIDNFGKIYDSLSEAALYNDISVQTVCDILKGRHNKTRKGISFKYA